MRRLLVSTSAGDRRRAASSWLEELTATATPRSEILVLAPTRGAAHDLVRLALAGRGAFGVRRATPRQLAAELALDRLAERGAVPVGGLGLEALAARALAVCRDTSGRDTSGRDTAEEGDEDGLEYFSPVADLPGMPRALARTLEELRLFGVEPGHLAPTSSGPEPGAATSRGPATSRERGRDLSALLGAFTELLDQEQLVDPPAIFQAAHDALEAGTRRHAGGPLLLLDLSPDSPLESRFLAALAARSSSVLATALGGDVEGVARLEAALGTRAQEIAEDEPPPRGPERRLDRLRRHVFAERADWATENEEGENGKAQGAPEIQEAGGESLVFLSAPGENRECAEIARRLHQLTRDGVPFDRCAVALRDPDTYLPLIVEALSRAGIEPHTTRGTHRPDPAGRAFLALLACADERLSATRFAEYLSLAQLPDADAEGAPPEVAEVPWVTPKGDQLVLTSLLTAADDDSEISSSGEDGVQAREDEPVIEGSLRTPRRWERLLVDAAVIEGRDRWRRRLKGVRRERELQLRRAADAEDVDRHRLEVELRQLDALARFALPLIDQLDALPEEATWGAWLEHLERLATRAVRQSERVLETLAELRPMASVGPVSLEEVRRVLEERLATLRSEPQGRRWGRVLVATLDELRGRSFHTVFLPGLAEGRFPRRAGEDPLLPDADRRRLDLAEPLPTLDVRVERERRLLRLAVGAAEERLVVSYPSLDPLEGRARVPSFYALDLLRAAEGRFPDLRSLEQRAAAASSSRLGWPAPRRAADAVDDAEFDIATLLELIDQGPSATGRARYLLEINPRLRRSLRNRYSRWTSRRFSAADGLVSDDAEVLAILGEHRLAERSYSPTALQTFAACPYRFLLYAVHRLRPRDTIERLEKLDPLTRGALFHEVVFELLGQLRSSRLLPMTAERMELLFKLSDQVLDSVAGRYAEELAPAIARVWHSEIESLRLDLRGWIRTVIAEDEGWRPARFELAFGLPAGEGHDPASSTEEAVVDGARLRGSIDLVEIDDDNGVVRVTDHKTGRARTSARLQVGGGEVLQPLLYALAAERLLEQRVIAGRLFYCTHRGGFTSSEVALDEDGRDAVDVVLTAVDEAVEGGFLPATPRPDACRFCDYQPICGPSEEQRVSRKRPDPRLAGLRHVRTLP